MSQQSKIDGFHVIVAAAGHGTRMGGETPKQYIKIAGKAILRHTLDNIAKWPGVKSIRVIIDPSHANMYHNATKGLSLDAPVNGGKERNESISKGLESFPKIKSEEIILIHDAARPLVKSSDVDKLISTLERNRAATLATKVSDTLRKATNLTAGEVIERNGLWAIQTPQAFRYADIKKAHNQASQSPKHYTDDTSLMSDIAVEVALVEGSRGNIKITTKEDLEMAQAMLSNNYRFSSGTGFDVHAFEKVPSGKPLTLGGVEIDHDRSLEGHSDADVALHAITDAILGAIGQGDIGQHFPPSDNKYKDMDSAIFLQKAVEMTHHLGGEFQNIDLTIICESPKIGPHKDLIKERIAQITQIPAVFINVKATTTEKLGFTGRGEGIAAQAIANVKLPIL